LFELHSKQMLVYLLQADPSLLPEVEEDVMAECTKIGPIDRLRVSKHKREVLQKFTAVGCYIDLGCLG
jgi:hypothetical protein